MSQTSLTIPSVLFMKAYWHHRWKHKKNKYINKKENKSKSVLCVTKLDDKFKAEITGE